MKRTIALILVLALAVALSGCGAADDPNSPSGTPTGAASPSPIASPLASPLTTNVPVIDDDITGLDPTVIDPLDEPGLDEGDMGDLLETGDDPLDAGEDDPVTPATPATTAPAATANPAAAAIKIKDYVLEDYSDDTLGFTLKYPSHWTIEPGSNSLSFVEPVEAGKNPMRMVLTVKSYDADKLTTAAAKKEFQDYLKVVKGTYGAFKAGKVNSSVSFMNRASLSCNYNAKLDGANVRGFVIMGSIARTKQIVALHFSAPLAKFKNSGNFFRKILYSVTPHPAATAEPTTSPIA